MSRAFPPLPDRTGMKLLRNLFGKAQVSHGRYDRNSKLHEASYFWFDKVNSIDIGGPKIDLNSLP